MGDLFAFLVGDDVAASEMVGMVVYGVRHYQVAGGVASARHRGDAVCASKDVLYPKIGIRAGCQRAGFSQKELRLFYFLQKAFVKVIKDLLGLF